MNNRYNYSDFSGISLHANNELPHQRTADRQAQPSTRLTAADRDKRIKDVLPDNNKVCRPCD